MIKDTEGLLKHIESEIRSQCDVALIGLSGGADSTLVASICSRALGPTKVVGIHMPYSKVDSEGTKFNAMSVRLARKLGIKEEYIPITEIADAISKAIIPPEGDFAGYRWGGEEKLNQLDKGNARARARMAVLYGMTGYLAHSDFKGERVRVVGTGNLSEDFIGYDTKGGDALADFHPIGRLYKSEVYQMLDVLKGYGMIDEEHIDRVPSAGLWDGQTDEGELGHTYGQMEVEIRDILEKDRQTLKDTSHIVPGGLDHFVLSRHLTNKHKHAAIPSFDLSEFVD